MLDVSYRSGFILFHCVVHVADDNLGGRIPIAVGMLDKVIG